MPETNDELDGAVAKFWREMTPSGGMAVKWFLTIEGMDDQGQRSLDFAWSADLKTWEQKGMLHEALDGELAIEVAREVRE